MAEMRLIRPARILMLGAPGVGKGTFASRLARTWRIPHIATGDIIRSEIQNQTDIGKQFKEFTNRGDLVPDDLVNELAKKRLTQLDVVSNGYILDGFPRTLNQAKALATYADPHLCVNITLPDKHLIAKISGRRVCRNCKANYNVATIKDGPYDMPPLLPKDPKICDHCHQKLDLFQRDDDAQDVVIQRLEIYRHSTAPLVNLYAQLGILQSFEVYKGVADLPELSNLIITHMEDYIKKQRGVQQDAL